MLSPPSNSEGNAPLGSIPPLDSEGDRQPSTGGGDARDEDKKPPGVLDMEYFCWVNDLIQQEKEDELLLIKDDDPDRPVNLIMDPVLSVVIACRKTDLALRFIDKLPGGGRLENRNCFGDTALHVAAAMNDHRVVKALVLKNPDIVELRNEKYETALHKAALNGHRSMFWWLVKEGKSYVFSRRKDGATVLHCAIICNAPALALEIAKAYEGLIMSRNENAVTPLQLMVTIPDLFRSKLVLGALDELIYSWIPIEVNQDSITRPRGDEEDASAKTTHCGVAIKGDHGDLLWKRTRKRFPSSYATILDFVELITIPAAGWTRTIILNLLRPVFPRIQSLERKKKKHKEAIELTAYLAQPRYMGDYKRGNSGATTSNSPADPNLVPQNPEKAKVDEGSKKDAENVMRWNEPPLILGAQMGLDDFVEKILQVCPQSVTYCSTKGRSVLRVAIESGSRKIVRIINKMAWGDNPNLLSWLYFHVDVNTRNTILHFAAARTETGGDAFQFQDELKWFEEVKKFVPYELLNYRNKEEMTAQELFSKKHETMVGSCKKQLVQMGITGCSSLVAAVVFASAISIPGEKNQDTSNPLYFDRLPFRIFFHAYVVGFGCAAMSLVLFLSLVIAPYKESDFRRAVPMKYFLACLSFAMVQLAFLTAFTCSIFLEIYGGQRTERKDLIRLLLDVTLFPAVCFIVLLYNRTRFVPSFSRLWAAD